MTALVTASELPDKLPIGKNGGSLYAGGVPGNRGGLGKPPNEIRARMRQHLDEELIQACLDDWKAGKLNPLQVAEFFAKHALPTQSESLNKDEAQQMWLRWAGFLVDRLRPYVADDILRKAFDDLQAAMQE